MVDGEPIKSYKYTSTINGVECYVPIDNKNTDYQAILAWVANGNTIAEAD